MFRKISEMHYITGSLALNPVHSKVDKTGQTVPGKGLNRLWMFGVLLLVAFGKCFYRFSCLQILQGNGGIEQACISICCTFLLISFDSLRATQGCRDNLPKQSMPMQCYFCVHSIPSC